MAPRSKDIGRHRKARLNADGYKVMAPFPGDALFKDRATLENWIAGYSRRG